jgi:hypothetical protein
MYLFVAVVVLGLNSGLEFAGQSLYHSSQVPSPSANYLKVVSRDELPRRIKTIPFSGVHLSFRLQIIPLSSKTL